MGLFKKRSYITIPTIKDIETRQATVPDGLWEKCPKCHQMIYLPDMPHYKACPHCDHYYRLSASERLGQLVDQNSFQEWLPQTAVSNPLQFPNYEEKLQQLKERTKLDEAVVVGSATIDHKPVAIGVMDTHFIMGSMGSVVGEKITQLFEQAQALRLPVVLCCASGGARMQEGIISLMQMAKISTAVTNHSAEGLLYIAVLTDPTTGGVTASFAMEADIIVAEPRATVGFAGRRVIEQTIKETLPEDFQEAESVQKNGFIDCIVKRPELRTFLAHALMLHQEGMHENS